LTLNWNDNSLNETSFVVQKSIDGGLTWIDVGTSPSPLALDNTHGTRSFGDTTFAWGDTPLHYRVVALNTIGYGGEFMSLSAKSFSTSVPIIASPTNLTASLLAGPAVNVRFMDNARNETGFILERSVDGVNFSPLTTLGPRLNTGNVTYIDNAVILGNTYWYRVATLVGAEQSPYSNIASIVVAVPTAPVGLAGVAVPVGLNERITLTWTDTSNNETGFTLQRALDSAFTNPVINTLPANQTSFTTGTLPRTTYYFRILAFNVVGQSAWDVAAPVGPARILQPAR
jgi:hypothetical protein